MILGTGGSNHGSISPNHYHGRLWGNLSFRPVRFNASICIGVPNLSAQARTPSTIWVNSRSKTATSTRLNSWLISSSSSLFNFTPRRLISSSVRDAAMSICVGMQRLHPPYISTISSNIFLIRNHVMINPFVFPIIAALI